MSRVAVLPRRVGIAVVCLAMVTVLAGCLSNNQIKVQNQVNADRVANGRAKLVDYSPADAKAQAWAEKLARDGRLSHSTLRDGYPSSGWCRLGENVGMGPTTVSIQAAFMKSSGHRANILDARFDHFGTGVATSANGTVFVVHEFVDIC